MLLNSSPKTLDCVAGLRIVDTVVTKIGADEDEVVEGDHPHQPIPETEMNPLGRAMTNILTTLRRAWRCRRRNIYFARKNLLTVFRKK